MPGSNVTSGATDPHKVIKDVFYKIKKNRYIFLYLHDYIVGNLMLNSTSL